MTWKTTKMNRKKHGLVLTNPVAKEKITKSCEVDTIFLDGILPFLYCFPLVWMNAKSVRLEIIKSFSNVLGLFFIWIPFMLTHILFVTSTDIAGSTMASWKCHWTQYSCFSHPTCFFLREKHSAVCSPYKLLVFLWKLQPETTWGILNQSLKKLNILQMLVQFRKPDE